jgi:hypothetical protein
MMVLEIFSIYLALGALFYLGLTATATDSPGPRPSPAPKWQRARRMKDSALRRLRPLLALRLPKRTR